eukprot:1760020-Pleurochrysis_carterae.AAC.1
MGPPMQRRCPRRLKPTRLQPKVLVWARTWVLQDGFRLGTTLRHECLARILPVNCSSVSRCTPRCPTVECQSCLTARTRMRTRWPPDIASSHTAATPVPCTTCMCGC